MDIINGEKTSQPLSTGLYTELQQYGARATCIIPAAAGTDFQKNSGIDDVAVSLNVEDIANAVWFLSSDQSANTTGSELIIDGGMHIQLHPSM